MILAILVNFSVSTLASIGGDFAARLLDRFSFLYQLFMPKLASRDRRQFPAPQGMFGLECSKTNGALAEK
jgi:hypothetical protein